MVKCRGLCALWSGSLLLGSVLDALKYKYRDKEKKYFISFSVMIRY
uniref:Uncharacterized protein n=2 Tax=Oryzias sinensis TaxID=183150 RepID=A0A8C7WYN5_9TELE